LPRYAPFNISSLTEDYDGKLVRHETAHSFSTAGQLAGAAEPLPYHSELSSLPTRTVEKAVDKRVAIRAEPRRHWLPTR
jgi:hypothetical protein